jgi:hypothetical protein
MMQNLFGHLKFKILSLILGFGTWWMISQEIPRTPSYTRDFPDIPVRILVPPEYTNSVQLSPETINVKLRGPSRVLDNLSPSLITAYVRVAERQNRVRTIQPAIFLSPDLIVEGVTVEEVPRVTVEISPPSQ